MTVHIPIPQIVIPDHRRGNRGRAADGCQSALLRR